MLLNIIFSLLIFMFSFWLVKILFNYKLLAKKFQDYNQAIKSLFLKISDNSKNIDSLKKFMDQVSWSGISLLMGLLKSLIPFIFSLFFIKIINPEISYLFSIIISTIPYLFPVITKK